MRTLLEEESGLGFRVGCTYLVANALQAGQREVRLVTVLPVIFLELVQVGSQQLAHEE